MGATATIVYDDEEDGATEDVDVGNLEAHDDRVVIAYESADEWIPRTGVLYRRRTRRGRGEYGGFG